MKTIYTEILGVAPDADLDSIKQAYRQLARANHPDHFPANQRPMQELRMMQINEAYEILTRSTRTVIPAENRQGESTGFTAEAWYTGDDQKQDIADTSGIGTHKDPAYAYYKQGFNEYSRGVGGMMLRGNRKITPDATGLQRTIQALQHFQSAYRYFQRVVEEYPDSIWSSDARYKLHRLERFKDVYQRIQKNLKNIKIGTDTESSTADKPSTISNHKKAAANDSNQDQSDSTTSTADDLADMLEATFGEFKPEDSRDQ